MANNPNALAGLTAISPTISAYQNFVEQKDKVNGANIIPFLVSRGEPQLAGLIAKKLRIENAAKTQQQMAQQPPAAPPTVAQQYDAALAQQQAPRMPQAPMAPPAQMPPSAGGVAAMPNPAMERGFAGGGIVAFSGEDGSLVRGNNPYEFNDDLLSNVPSFMTDTTDIISFVRKQMPSFDALSPVQKQEVLKRFEPAYKEAYKSLQTLKARGAAPASAITPVIAPAIAPAKDSTAVVDPSAFRRGPENALEVAQDLRRIQERATTAPDANLTAPERRNQGSAVPRVVVPTAPKGDMFTQFERPTTDVDTERAARIERQRAAKTGEFSQADADLAAYVKEQKAQGGDTKEAYRNFWVMAGASLMANKSPYFLQGLGESIRDNYGGLVNDLKQLKDDTKSLRLQEIQLRRAQEQAMESGSKADQDRVDRLNEKADATNLAIATARSAIEQKDLDRRHNVALEKLRASNRPQDRSMAQQLIDMYDAIQIQPDPAKRQIMQDAYEKRMEAVEKITRVATATGLGADIREQIAADERIAKLSQNNLLYRRASRIKETSTDPAERARAKQLMRDMELQASGDVEMSGGPYSVSGWNQ